MNNYATLDDLLRAQERAKFEAGQYGMNEFYSPQMSMAAQPNMSPVNPQQADEKQNQFLNMLKNAEYAGLAPIQHHVAQITRGGQPIQPIQVAMTPYGSGMAGIKPKDDDKDGLLNMLMKAMAGA